MGADLRSGKGVLPLGVVAGLLLIVLCTNSTFVALEVVRDRWRECTKWSKKKGHEENEA